MNSPTTTDPAPAFLTTAEFSRRVHLSTATVKRLCDAGEIAHVRVSDRGNRRILASEVDRLRGEALANRVAGQD